MVTPQKETRLKLNPQAGRMPVLQFLPPAELEVDPTYQRSIEAGDSQALIKRIAQGWNWDLCLPLVVSRRRGELRDRYFVIDGQHRLTAATLRGDIGQLPCVVLEFPSEAGEAESFVALNQVRKPLKRADIFRAAVASGDKEACAIFAAITDAELTIARGSNPTTWKPRMIYNVAGIETAWRRKGAKATRLALHALAQGFGGQVLQYAGTLFPGIVAVCFDEFRNGAPFAGGPVYKRLVAMLASRSQDDWRRAISAIKGEEPDLSYAAASEVAMRRAWQDAPAAPQPKASSAPAVQMTVPVNPSAPRWCDQCEGRISPAAAAACKSRFCKMKDAA